MKRSPEPNAVANEPSPRTRPQVFLDLFRAASSQTLIRAAITVAVAWVPPAVLSVIGGRAAFVSFLTDYASTTRFLIVIPVLILAEPQLRDRLDLVVHHFERYLVPRDQVSSFQSEWVACEKLRDSNIARGLLVLLTYGTAAFLGRYLGHEFESWWRGAGGFRAFSLAGTWALFISYPILACLIYLWLWRQLLWVRFLWVTTRYDLRLIAARVGALV